MPIAIYAGATGAVQPSEVQADNSHRNYRRTNLRRTIDSSHVSFVSVMMQL